MIRTLIVDDELYAREELMQHLAAEPDIELLGRLPTPSRRWCLFSGSNQT